MENKICTKCNENKNIEDYYKSVSKKTGKIKVYSCCKKCFYETSFTSMKKHRERVNRTNRIGYKNNPKIKRMHASNYAKRNSDKIKQRWKEYYKKNRERLILKSKKYSIDNKEKIRIRINKKQKIKFSENEIFNIAHSLRTRIYRAFNQNRWNKGKSTEQLLGTNYETAKKHIERQFKNGMSWNNRGDWHIDHKIPLSSAKTKDDLILLCHYTNLQPLWKKDNLSKSNKILPIQTVLNI